MRASWLGDVRFGSFVFRAGGLGGGDTEIDLRDVAGSDLKMDIIAVLILLKLLVRHRRLEEARRLLHVMHELQRSFAGLTGDAQLDLELIVLGDLGANRGDV